MIKKFTNQIKLKNSPKNSKTSQEPPKNLHRAKFISSTYYFMCVVFYLMLLFYVLNTNISRMYNENCKWWWALACFAPTQMIYETYFFRFYFISVFFFGEVKNDFLCAACKKMRNIITEMMTTTNHHTL